MLLRFIFEIYYILVDSLNNGVVEKDKHELEFTIKGGNVRTLDNRLHVIWTAKVYSKNRAQQFFI